MKDVSTAWHDRVPSEAGFAHMLSSAMHVVEQQNTDFLWPVRDGPQLLVSDYSGQHRQATHEVYSFLITTKHVLDDWLPQLAEFRQTFLPDGRRLSFKQLREPVRRRAYPHFLGVVARLPANLITIMIDNRVGPIAPGGPAETALIFDDCFPANVSAASVEKMFRLAYFIALLGAGLRNEEQSSLWISDHDETLDTFDKREGLGRLTSYLSFGFTGWRNPAQQNFLTTGASNCPRWVEDLAAIPDIAAGACAQLSNTLPLFEGSKTWTIRLLSHVEPDWRAKVFGDWLSEPNGVLRHVLLRLAPDETGEVRASAQKFVRRSI
jgi:hypothetical protein